MADEIDTGVKSVEATCSGPLLDRPLAQAPRHQLSPSHHAVLSLGEGREPTIVIASPRKGFFGDRFRGLGGHPPSLPGNLTRVARSL